MSYSRINTPINTFGFLSFFVYLSMYLSIYPLLFRNAQSSLLELLKSNILFALIFNYKYFRRVFHQMSDWVIYVSLMRCRRCFLFLSLFHFTNNNDAVSANSGNSTNNCYYWIKSWNSNDQKASHKKAQHSIVRMVYAAHCMLYLHTFHALFVILLIE